MTGPENERLAVVETKVDALALRFATIEPKVDLLVERSAAWSGATSFLRALVPFIAVGVSLAAFAVSMTRS